MFRYLRVIPTAFLFLSLSSCRQPEKGPDPEISKLQEDVHRLAQENEKLLDEIKAMRRELTEQREKENQAAQTKPAEREMTVDRMKLEVQPVLQETIHQLKAVTDTPRKGKQFGMRTEYDLKRAVFGLVRSDDPRTPYFAKVVVRYERFLESENESKSYGFGTINFLFAYRNGHWLLETYQN